MRTDPEFRWRRSTASSSGGDCVELGMTGSATAGAVRDSKDPAGHVLDVDLAALVAAARNGSLDQA